MHVRIVSILLILLSILATTKSYGQTKYLLNPGDIVSVFVWGNEELNLPEALIRPDGNLSIPLIGEITVGGLTVETTQELIADKLAGFLKDKPVVIVSVTGLAGNTIYVLGKVNRPGEYILRRNIDVLQALALAGGVTTFANENGIIVIRREEKETQKITKFRYGKVKSGKSLEDNILLKSGDVVLVP